MAVDPVTPIAGLTSVVAVGGTPVNAVAGGPNGGLIVNPYTPTSQDLADAEPLYIDPVGAAGVEGNGTTFELQPGQSWTLIPGQTTPTSVNAPSSGHKFTVISW